MWTPESRLTTRATPDRCFVKPRKPGDKCPFWSVVIGLSITTGQSPDLREVGEKLNVKTT